MSYNYDDFNGNSLIFKYNIDSNGNPVSIAVSHENKQVSTHGTIQLEFIPDKLNRVIMLDENNNQMIEVFNKDDVDTSSFYIDYNNGVAYLDKSQFGKTKIYNYYNKGIQLIGCSRIYDEHDVTGKHVMMTLQEILDAGKNYIQVIELLGGAVPVLQRLETDIADANYLHDALTDDIAIGAPLQANLHQDVIDGNVIQPILNNTVAEANSINTELEGNIFTGTALNQELDDTIVEANTTKTQLDTSITDAQDDIAIIESTGNFSQIIELEYWVYNFDTERYEYTLNHDLYSENLMINIIDNATKEPIFNEYKILNNSNILFWTDTTRQIKVILNGMYYKATVTISDDIAQEVVEARHTDATLNDRLNKLDTLNSTGNFMKIIYTGDWVLNNGRYEHTVVHSLNSKNLLVNLINNTTGISFYPEYKLIDDNSILIYSDTAIEMRVVIGAKFYKAIVPISDKIAEEVIEARGGEIDLKQRYEGIDNRLDEFVENTNSKFNDIAFNLNNLIGTDTEKFINACAYCITNSLILYVPKDISITLNSDVNIPSIVSNNSTITIVGTGRLIPLSNSQFRRFKIERQDISDTFYNEFTINNIAFNEVEIKYSASVEDGSVLSEYAIRLKIGSGLKLNDVTIRNYNTPIRIEAVNGFDLEFKNIKCYNVGHGIYVKGYDNVNVAWAKNIRIDGLYVENTNTQLSNILTNYCSTSNAGYDGILLEHCDTVEMTNIYCRALPERMLYVSTGNNIRITNSKAINTGGIKFVGMVRKNLDGTYQTISAVADGFMADDISLRNCKEEAMVQLYDCQHIHLNNIKHQAEMNGYAEYCGWFLRCGRYLRDIKITNCHADSIRRNFIDYEGQFANGTIYSDDYDELIDGLTVENCTGKNIGLIKNSPLPCINFIQTKTPVTQIFKNIRIINNDFLGTNARTESDTGIPNGYGVKNFIEGDWFSNLFISGNKVRGYGISDIEQGSTLPFNIGANSVKVILQHEVITDKTINPSTFTNCYCSHGSEINFNTSLYNTDSKYNVILKMKPMNMTSFSTGNIANLKYNMGVIGELMSDGQGADLYMSILDLTGFTDRVGCMTINSVDGIGYIAINNTNLTTKAHSDTNFDSGSWATDGKIRLYMNGEVLQLRCTTNKILNGSLILQCKS